LAPTFWEQEGTLSGYVSTNSYSVPEFPDAQKQLYAVTGRNRRKERIVSVAECVAQLLLIAIPVAILALINADHR